MDAARKEIAAAGRKPKPADCARRCDIVMPTSARSYAEKRDFSRTPEPADAEPRRSRRKGGLRYVVQRHDASRLHFDFRLEHEGTLLSWAVPKGPSLNPGDKRLAVRTEDHPLAYADFAGEIPAGNYGAGTVEIWDAGSWEPRVNPAEGLALGDLKFRLDGTRYRGNFVLVRMKPRGRERAENWLLIKERDDDIPTSPSRGSGPAAGAGSDYRPQLATLVATAPVGPEWVTEIKFDGYRLIAAKDGNAVHLLTRNGLDWTHRLPTLAAAIGRLEPTCAVLDGELVAFAHDGTTSFSKLQEALSEGRDGDLAFMAFDLLVLGRDDLRSRPLCERKDALAPLIPRPRRGRAAPLRLSEHLDVDAAKISREACRLGLEGVVCKRLDRPYRAGRGRDWVKVKCSKRDEMVILGWTAPRGSRKGLGAVHLGLHGAEGKLAYVGGCGTGFSEDMLGSLAARLERLASDRPKGLVTPDKPPARLNWVRPELVAEIGHAGFTDGGMVRHARFLGLREDKPARDVTRADTEPAPSPRCDGARSETRKSHRFTHPDRELWPGITKRDLGEYWALIADHALPGIANRPLALLRCPEGIAGETFFQKHAMRGHPPGIFAGKADGAPFLAISDARGFADLSQLSAIELHAWGASLAAPTRPDQLVFDLDPDQKVSFAGVIDAARDIRGALEALGLSVFIRTTGGKGLHLVVPVAPGAGWDETRAWTRAFATALERAEPKRFIASSTRKNVRSGKILIDWLRNGLGSTAIASFSPRARDGAPVATPIARSELTPKLDPTAFTLRTIPARLAHQRRDPWAGFLDAAVDKLPDVNWKD